MIEQSQVDQVCRRISQVRQQQSYRDRPKEAIRLLCGPPEQALEFLLGSLGDVNAYSIPAANLVLSGLRRLAQKIGRVPDLRVPTPVGDEKESTRKRVEKRSRIITSWDDTIHANGSEYGDCLENTLYQSGMWLPGYTFTSWVVKEGRTHDGDPYPALINLDPYGTYPTSRDTSYVYGAKLGDLAARYPHHRAALLGERQSNGAVLLDRSDNGGYPAWGAYGQGSDFHNPGGSEVEVVEYYNDEACWVVVPSKRLLLEHYPNPLSGPQFITTEMFSFGQPVGQYDHTIGLQSQIASFNALAAIAMKDAVHTETNVFGELLSGQYRKGRFAVNYFTPGTRIEKPATNLPYQLFQELDRLEKQFRTTAGYSPVDDAISPAAQATGQGIDRLTAGIDLEVKQFLTLFRRSTQLADRKRLEWMEKCHPDETIRLEGVMAGQSFDETYTPSKDIKGNYRTRRTYGAMAGLDDQNKISALLLLKQGEMLDSTSAMEELDLGGRSVSQVQERIEDEKIRRTLMEAMATGQPMDPRVAMTLIEMLPESQFKEAARKFWTPDEPAMSPEQEAMLGMGAPAGPPDIMSMLGMGAPPEGMPMEGAPMPEGMPV